MSVVVSVVPIIIGIVASSITSGTGVMMLAQKDKLAASLPTDIKNEELLYQALTNLGANNIAKSKNTNILEGKIDDMLIQFVRNNSGFFEIKYYGKIDNNSAQSFADDLQSEYGAIVQNHVYQRLKENAEKNGLKLRGELLQEDQTIVLTYKL